MAFTRTTINTTGDFTSGNTQVLNVANTTGLYAGLCVYGPNISADTIINSVAGTTVTLSKAAQSTGIGGALTGQYITQTGTDANPSGLSSIAGVTTIAEGTGTSLTATYNLGTNQLRVQGTLTHDPDQYKIVGNVQMAIKIESGVYNYGVDTTINGKTSYSKACGIDITYRGGIASNFPMQLVNGVFNHKGGIIRIGGAFSMPGGSYFQTGDTACIYNNNSGTQIQMRSTLPASNISYNKIRLAGVNTVFFWTTNSYGAISGILENGAIQTPSGYSSVTQVYNNFVFANNQAAADFYLNQLTGTSSTLSVVKNPDTIPRVLQLNSGAYGVLETRTALSFALSDENNLPTSTVVGYVRDTDNGARTNENQLAYTSDRVYITTSSAGAMSFPDILVDVQMRNPLATLTVKHDYRSNYGNTSSDFDVYLWGYDYLPAKTRQTLLGNNGVSVRWTEFGDSNVTLSSTAAYSLLGTEYDIDPVAQTLTVLASSTYSRAYDAIKAYKSQNNQTALETPSIDRLILTPNGGKLTLEPGWELIVPTGVVFAADSKFQYVYADVVTNDGTIDGAYGVPAGNQTVWEFQDVEAGSSIAVWDIATGDVLFFEENVPSGTYRYYIDPGATGTYGYAVEKYGNRREFGTFPANAGQIIFYKPDNVQDISIFETNKAVVATYTELSTASAVNDYEAYWRTTQVGIVNNDTLVRNGETLDWTPYDVQIDPTAGSVYSLTGNQIVVKTPNLVANTVTTTGTVSYANGGKITGVVTDVNGVSTLVKITNLTGCSVAIVDDNGELFSFDSNVAGTHGLVAPANFTGSWSYVITKFGRKPQTGTFVLGQGVAVTINYVEIVDERIVDDVLSTVLGYTELNTTQKMYDYWSYWITTQQGIVWYNTVTWNGAVLDTDGADLDVDPFAVDVASLDPSTNKVTIRATVLDGDIRTDGVVSRLNGASTTGIVVDSTGTTTIVTFSGFTGDNQLYVQDEFGVQRAFVPVNTPGYSLYLLPSQQTPGLWTWAAKKVGFNHALGNFAVGDGGRLQIRVGMEQILQPDGTAMFTSTPVPTTIEVDWQTSGDGTPRIKLGDRAYLSQDIYNAVDVSLQTLDGLKWLTNGYSDVRIAILPAGNFIFLSQGWRFMESAVGNSNAGVNGFAISTDGQTIDDSNGPVSLLSTSSAISDADLLKIRETWDRLVNYVEPKVDTAAIDLEDIKGTGFVKDVHSLTSIETAVQTSIAVSA